MIGVGLFLCVLALILIGQLFCIAWDITEHDERIIALEATVRDQAAEIRGLNAALDEIEHREKIAP